jgi:hypothetical protein
LCRIFCTQTFLIYIHVLVKESCQMLEIVPCALRSASTAQTC